MFSGLTPAASFDLMLVAYADLRIPLAAEVISLFLFASRMLAQRARLDVIENPDPWAKSCLDGWRKELVAALFFSRAE